MVFLVLGAPVTFLSLRVREHRLASEIDGDLFGASHGLGVQYAYSRTVD